MAVSNTEQVSAVDFVRWRGGRRSMCVGTFDQDVEVAGAAGGGTVQLSSSWSGEEWGFNPIIVMKAVVILATADPGFVRVSYEAQGNIRLQGAIGYGYDTVVVNGVHLTPEYTFPKIAVEPSKGPGTDNFMRVTMDTNTDSNTYHMHLFGLVFDIERMAKSGDYREISEALM